MHGGIFLPGRRAARRCVLSARTMVRRASRRVSPVCALALGLWSGFGLGALFPNPLAPVGLLPLALASVIGAVAISLGALLSRRDAAALRLAGALCCGLAVAGAVLRYQAQRAWAGENPPGSEIHLSALEGKLEIDAQSTAKGNRRLDLGLGAAEWAGPGCRIRAEWGRRAFAAEVLTGPVGQMHAGTWLRASSLRAGAFLWADLRAVTEQRGAGPLASLRGILADGFAAAIHVCAGGAGSLAQALLLGVKDELDGEYRGLFQAAGCAHLLALSGQHLAIICAFVALVGKRISHRPRAVRRISLGFAWIFVWLAGPGPSLLRAVFMLTVAELAHGMDRPQTGLSVLSIASLLLALAAPSSINSLSSVFSFGAMAGLMLLSPSCSALLRPWLPKPVAEGLAASIAAVCATAPISIVAFGSFVPAGILSATASAPIMLAFMWIALGGSAVVALLPFASAITRPVLEFLESALVWVLECGARFPSVRVGASPFAGALAILVIASIVTLIYAVPRMRQRSARALLSRARLELPCADPKTRLALLGAREAPP